MAQPPPGQQSAYPPQGQSAYPPQGQSAYPPQGGQPGRAGGAYPPQGGQPGAYPPQGGQPGGAYPPQQGGAYPPQGGAYPPQAGRGGAYPPQGGAYPPQGGAYPPGGSMYPPAGGSMYPAQPGYGAGAPHLSAYGQQYYGMIDQGRMMELRGYFSSVDKDKSGHISAQELTHLQFAGKTFSLVTAKDLLKVFDVDKSGSISFEEYAALHQFVVSMQAAFYQHDRDGSGKLDTKEVLAALQQGGFTLSQPTVDSVIKKFKTGSAGFGAQGLDFEQFLRMSAFLGQIRSTFMVHDVNRSGW
eukprot:CAMPEP_0201480416 /NCGR_PEP_ID=MMETSP0151_2-20130828/4900_1 /ASSEMBLY_ACC=CAM_ASM_000257 /TAXON_ID=200890 /ORGANISM="Paramoeba atlantica, Strain 621/1 / CCAP 1560/9" /LENGTH=298 /DNA_ID=CAMNT_0047862257 /DNA_START=86 /DNA_END=979 /DNA_ORIENTATION=+